MLTFVIAFVLAYLYHGLGITIGYHRLLSHRSLKVPRWLEYFIVSGGYLGLEGSPISWVATHRVHHRYTDLPGDPHRPADGFWHSFAGWLAKPIVILSGEQIDQVCPDLARDPIYRFFDFNHTRLHAKVCLGLSILLRVVIFAFWGPWAVLGSLLGNAVVFVGPFWVNSVAHLPDKGYRNFDTSDSSRNVPWVGYWALGEGWHNNHHGAPQSARHGIKPNEFDLTWTFIWALRALGLASDVRMPKESKAAPAIEPEFALLLKQMSANEKTADTEAPELVAVRSQLLDQLNAARSLAAQLAIACDELSDQVTVAQQQFTNQMGNTREQLSDQLLCARRQLVEQLISGCDQLSDQLTVAKIQVGEQVRGACEQLSDNMLAREAETA